MEVVPTRLILSIPWCTTGKRFKGVWLIQPPALLDKIVTGQSRPPVHLLVSDLISAPS